MATSEGGCSYVMSIQGICNIAEMVIGIIAGCLVGINFVGSVVYYFEVVVIASCIYTLINFIMKASGKPFGKVQSQFGAQVFYVVLYIIVSALAIHYGQEWAQVIAGGAMGIVAGLVHLLNAVDIYRKRSS